MLSSSLSSSKKTDDRKKMNAMQESKSNDTIHGLTKPALPMTMTLPIKIHDYFNIISIIIIIVIDINYLRLRSPSISDMFKHKIGTPIYDERLDYDEATHLPFTLLMYVFTSYLLIDTLWIILQPACVLGNRASIIFHHVGTYALVLLPTFRPYYHYHMGLCLLVEFNSLTLVCRRHTTAGSLAYSILNYLFYISWIVLRLILFPFLTYFFLIEYIRDEDTRKGIYLNQVITAPILQFILTSLSVMWTIDLLKKMFKKDKKDKKA